MGVNESHLLATIPEPIHERQDYFREDYRPGNPGENRIRGRSMPGLSRRDAPGPHARALDPQERNPLHRPFRNGRSTAAGAFDVGRAQVGPAAGPVGWLSRDRELRAGGGANRGASAPPFAGGQTAGMAAR